MFIFSLSFFYWCRVRFYFWLLSKPF